MRSGGVDLASAGPSAFALVINKKLVSANIWQPPDKSVSEPEKLELFYKWIKTEIWLAKPDIVAVERLMGYSRNIQAVTMVGRREGIALLVARQYGAIVINPGITSSRKSVFGKGNLSKDEAWELRSTIWPGFDFGRKTTGGLDRVAAATHATAAPNIIERKK